MESYYIDSYHYNSKKDRKKVRLYTWHLKTIGDIKKKKELMNKIKEFIIKTAGTNADDYFNRYVKTMYIEYRKKFGYISVINADYDFVRVTGYGKTLEEAFYAVAIEYEFSFWMDYCFLHREELNKQFSNRFLNGEYSIDEYDCYDVFFSCEFALQDFRKYYDGNIPKELINFYEEHLKKAYEIEYKYDYEKNMFIRASEK